MQDAPCGSGAENLMQSVCRHVEDGRGRGNDQMDGGGSIDRPSAAWCRDRTQPTAVANGGESDVQALTQRWQRWSGCDFDT